MFLFASGGRDSAVGIATRYKLDGPGTESRWGARFSAPVRTGPGAYPASCTMGTGSFPGVKRPGCGADHPPPPKRRGHERVELYLYSPSGPSWPVMGRTLPFASPQPSRKKKFSDRKGIGGAIAPLAFPKFLSAAGSVYVYVNL